jgi:hypothetical protein
MLVEHDVEAKLVGEHPFVVIAVEQIGGGLGSHLRFGRLTRSEPPWSTQPSG